MNDYCDFDPNEKTTQPRCESCHHFIPVAPNFCWTNTQPITSDTYDNDTENLDKHIIEGQFVVHVEGSRCRQCGWIQNGHEISSEKVVFPEPKVLQWVKVKEESRNENGIRVYGAEYEAREIAT